MSNSLGNLLVTLGLDSTDYTSGLTKAEYQAKKSLDAIKGQAVKLGALFGVGLSVNAFKNLIDSGVEARTELLKLSQQSQISVESLSALGKVGSLSGTGLDSITGASVRFNKALAGGAEGSKDTKRALDALGLSYASLKGATPEEQFLKVAKALAGFEDGTGKATAATLLFGKSGAELLPFLIDLGKQTELVGKVTSDSARQAREYANNLKAIEAAGEEWKKAFVTNIIPALVEFTGQLVDGRKAFGGYLSALTGIGLGTSAFQTAGENLKDVREQIDGVAAAIAKVQAQSAKGGLSAFFSAGPGDITLKKLQGQLEQLQKLKTYLVSQQTREALGGTAGEVLDRFDKKPRLNITGGGDKEKTPRDDFTPLFKRATEMNAALELALGSEVQLTEAQVFGSKVAADYLAGIIKLSDAQLIQLDGSLANASALENEAKAREAANKWISQATDENARFLESQLQLRDSLAGQAADAAQQLAQFGMTESAIAKLEVARLRDAAAAKLQKAAQAESAFLDDVAESYRKQAAAITATADAKQKLAEVKLATDQAKEFNDLFKNDFGNAFASFLDGSKSASDAFKAFTNSVVSDIARIVAQKAALAIFGEGGGVLGGAGSSGGLLGAFGSLFGSFAGGFANGGTIPPGQWGVVGERGKELAFGGTTGQTIVPATPGGASRTVVNHINVTVQAQAGMSQATAMQQGRDIGAGIRLAMARND